MDCRRLASVSRVRFECETKDGETFAANRPEKSMDNLFSESLLHVIVKTKNGPEESGDLWKVLIFGEICQIE